MGKRKAEGFSTSNTPRAAEDDITQACSGCGREFQTAGSVMRHLRYCKGTTPFTATVVDEPRPTELVEAVVVGNISTAPNHSIVGATYALHEANTEVMSSVAETEVIFNDKERAIAADSLIEHLQEMTSQ